MLRTPPKLAQRNTPFLPTVSSVCQGEADFLRLFVLDLPIPSGGLGWLVLLSALERTVWVGQEVKNPNLIPSTQSS